MKKTTIVLFLLLLLSVLNAQEKKKEERIPLLIRCDDIGMSHSVNRAAQTVLDAGFPVSMSVMVPCPWFYEAAALLKKYPHVSIGVHLTLNAEWDQYRWGPVTGSAIVPSLVDSLGSFFPSRSALFGNNPKLQEIEMELRAQIERALRAGLRVDYLDYHMGAAVQTNDTRAIVEKLAKEYGFGVSRYFNEVDVEGGYSAPVAHKLDTIVAKTKALTPGGTKLFVFHIGLDDPELGAMQDRNTSGPQEMSRHRNAELNALLDPQFQSLLHSPRFRPVNYRLLIQEKGLHSMKAPAQD